MKRNRRKNNMIESRIGLLLVVCFLWACGNDPVPKPRGYFRLDFPEKAYETYSSNCPFSFEKPTYSGVRKSTVRGADSCWFDMHFPELSATIHFTYLPIQDNLADYMEDAYNFAYKHNIKSSGIDRIGINQAEKDVYGLIYELKGDVASPLQFYLTDSTDHFLRGALYFRKIPNSDSLAPALNFIREDVRHLIETTSWKE